MIGSILGRLLNQRFDQQGLKQVFAVFLVVIGGFVMLHEGTKLARGFRQDDRAATQHVSTDRLVASGEMMR